MDGKTEREQVVELLKDAHLDNAEPTIAHICVLMPKSLIKDIFARHDVKQYLHPPKER